MPSSSAEWTARTSQPGVSSCRITERPWNRIASQSMKYTPGSGSGLNSRFFGDKSPTAMPCRWNTDSARAASRSSPYRRRSDKSICRRARKLSSLSRCWNSATSRLTPELFRICTKNPSGIAGITNPATRPPSSTSRHGHAAWDSNSIPSAKGSDSRYTGSDSSTVASREPEPSG